MNTVLIPPVTSHNLDPHSGFPFIPHMAGYISSAIKNFDDDLQILDAFSEGYKNINIIDDFMLIGLSVDEILKNISLKTKNIFIYARTVIDYEIIISITRELKKTGRYKIIIFENTQCVDALVLKPIAKDLLKEGSDVVLFGEPENRIKNVLDFLDGKVDTLDGAAYQINNKIYIKSNTPFSKELDKIKFPLWENWNFEGYWNLNYSHPPTKKKDKFVTLITSRGCPFRCTFCVAPELNPTWRFRSATNVVDEIEYFKTKLNINDFHISDLNPTIRESRFIEICNDLIDRNLNVTWKIAQGTKIETIKNFETFNLMYKAGCRFLSFSPESGSPEVMKNLINKSFKHEYALKCVSYLKKTGIRTQACFVIGMPEEQKKHRLMSLVYMIKLAIRGLDEVACYIITPLPGSKISDRMSGYSSLSECSHSPTWRKDFYSLYFFRLFFYISFIVIKIIFHPIQSLLVPFRILTLNFETKMEMAIFKKMKLIFLKLQFLILNKKNS